MMNSFRERGEGVSERVLVVSNVTVDETYAVETMPVPGESIIGRFQSRDVGGKGANVASVLARAGVPTRLIAGIGQDERGDHIRRSLAAESLILDLTICDACPSDLSLICTDVAGENAIVTTVAAAQCIDVARACQALSAMPVPGWLVLQGNLGAEMTASLVREARRCGHQVVLNPSPCSDWLVSLSAQVDVLILNEGEAERLSGLCDEAAVEALLQGQTTQVALTRGARGAILGSRDATCAGSPVTLVVGEAVAADVVDTTGAGDTWLGTALASAIRRNTRLDARALQHAAQAAAITVSRYGTRQAIPDSASLDALLRGH